MPTANCDARRFSERHCRHSGVLAFGVAARPSVIRLGTMGAHALRMPFSMRESTEAIQRPTRISSGVVRRQSDLPPRDIELVHESYARIEDRSSAVAIAFCERLFDVHPELCQLFPRGDAPARALAVSLLGFVVTNLRSTDRLCELLERMGARGLLVEVSSSGVDDMGRSFLATLREFEGTSWTADTAHAWALTYAWAAAAVRRGARRRTGS